MLSIPIVKNYIKEKYHIDLDNLKENYYLIFKVENGCDYLFVIPGKIMFCVEVGKHSKKKIDEKYNEVCQDFFVKSITKKYNIKKCIFLHVQRKDNDELIIDYEKEIQLFLSK